MQQEHVPRIVQVKFCDCLQVQRRPAPASAESTAALGESERSVLAKYGVDDEDDAEPQRRQHDASEDDENDE